MRETWFIPLILDWFTGLIHFTRQIYVCFDRINDLFTTRSKIMWIQTVFKILRSKSYVFERKSQNRVKWSKLSFIIIAVCISYVYNTTRHEIQHYLKNEKSEKITKNNTIIQYMGQHYWELRIQMKVRKTVLEPQLVISFNRMKKQNKKYEKTTKKHNFSVQLSQLTLPEQFSHGLGCAGGGSSQPLRFESHKMWSYIKSVITSLFVIQKRQF